MSDKQEMFHLDPPTDSGEDENGAYNVHGLSMLRGGEKKPFKVHLHPMKHIINTSSPAPRGWYKDKIVPDRQRPRPCYTEALLTTPYGGFCPIGCRFCYVDNGTRGYRATGLPTANPAYPDEMRKRVTQLQVSGAAYISSFTEPFLPRLEDHYRITERLTQVFLDEGLPLFYLSRRIPPAWAVNALLQNPYSYMQWSVNTSNYDHYRRMSPGSYSIDEVLVAVQSLSGLGIYTSFQCNPILPGITSLDEIKTLVRLGAQAGLRHIIFKFAEQVTGNRKMLLARLESAGLPGVDVFDRLFNQIVGGVYTIREVVRRFWLDELLAETRANNITMSTCYEYYDNGKGGASLAPYYTTSDQCHGRGVPVYFRPEPSAKFSPIPGCYRKGCLYCAERGTRACNNETLLQAKALDYQTMRKIKVIPTGAWGQVDSCWHPIECQGGGRNMNLTTDAEMWGLE